MDLESIGQRIVAARSARGISQRELAEHLDVRQMTLSHLENGLSCPTLPTLDALRRVLGMSLDEIVYGRSRSRR